MRGGRGGDRGPPRGYSRDPYDNAEVDVAAVEALLEERSGYRAKRMYDEADAVRDRLEQEHGVDVSDKDFEWTVRGVGFGGGGRGGGRGAPRGPPVEVSPMP